MYSSLTLLCLCVQIFNINALNTVTHVGYYSDYDEAAMIAGSQYAKDVHTHRTKIFGLEFMRALPDPKRPENPHRAASNESIIWSKWFERGHMQMKTIYHVLDAKERGQRVGSLHGSASASEFWRSIKPERINPYNETTEEEDFKDWMLGYERGLTASQQDQYLNIFSQQ